MLLAACLQPTSAAAAGSADTAWRIKAGRRKSTSTAKVGMLPRNQLRQRQTLDGRALAQTFPFGQGRSGGDWASSDGALPDTLTVPTCLGRHCGAPLNAAENLIQGTADLFSELLEHFVTFLGPGHSHTQTSLWNKAQATSKVPVLKHAELNQGSNSQGSYLMKLGVSGHPKCRTSESFARIMDEVWVAS